MRYIWCLRNAFFKFFMKNDGGVVAIAHNFQKGACNGGDVSFEKDFYAINVMKVVIIE